MNRSRSPISFRSAALLFSVAYLFYALTNILFLPRSLNMLANATAYSGFSPRRNSVDRGEHTINSSQLADKCFLGENPYNQVKFVVFLLPIVSCLFFTSTRRYFSSLNPRLFYNNQYSYLSLQTFRI